MKTKDMMCKVSVLSIALVLGGGFVFSSKASIAQPVDKIKVKANYRVEANALWFANAKKSCKELADLSPEDGYVFNAFPENPQLRPCLTRFEVEFINARRAGSNNSEKSND